MFIVISMVQISLFPAKSARYNAHAQCHQCQLFADAEKCGGEGVSASHYTVKCIG